MPDREHIGTGERRVRDEFVAKARRSDRSHTGAAPEPALPAERATTDEELDEVVEAASRRSPIAETGQAG
jgi:hypothetical protein